MTHTRLAVLVLLGLVLAASLAVLVHAAPISLHGKIDGALLDYLQHGPRPPDQPRFFPSHDAFPTLRLQEVRFVEHISDNRPSTEMSSTMVTPADFLAGLSQLGNLILTGAKGLLLLPFALLTQDGAATCGTGGGTCFWIGGTGSFNDGTHWSATSGGPTSNSTPSCAAGGDAVVFNGSSGGGTATLASSVCVAGTPLPSLTMTGFTGTFALSSFGINFTAVTLGGTLNLGSGTLASGSSGTGTWDFTTGTLTSSTGQILWQSSGGTMTWKPGSSQTYYNVTIGSGVTVNVSGTASSLTIAGALNVSATLNLGGWSVLLSGNATTVLSVTGTASGSGTISLADGTTNGSQTIVGNVGAWTVQTTQVVTGVTISLGGAFTTTGAVTTGVSAGNTMTLDTTASNYALTMGSFSLGFGTTFKGNNSTITLNGGFNISTTGGGATFTYGTSTLVFAANGTLTTPGVLGTNYLYNLTVNTSVVVTLAGHTSLVNAFTDNGSINGTSYRLQVNGPFTGTATTVNTSLYLVNTTATLPASVTTYYALLTNGTITLGVGLTITGAAGLNALWVAAGTLSTGASNFSITVQAGRLFVDGGTVLTAGASAVSIAGFLTGSTTSYVTASGSGSWTVSGAWTNGSTSASWSFGASITFNSATSQTLTFCNGCGGGGLEFGGNMTFDQSGGTGTTYTMATNALHTNIVVVTVQRSAGTGTVTLDTSAGNLAVTTGLVTIAANAALNARGSTITLNGNFNVGAGTFTYGTSTLSVGATGTYTFGTNPFYNLTTNNNPLTIDNAVVAAGGTLTAGSSTITMNGNFNSSAGTFTNGTSTVVFGANGTVTLSASQSMNNLTVNAAVTLTQGANMTVIGTLNLGNNSTVTGTGFWIEMRTVPTIGTGVNVSTVNLLTDVNSYSLPALSLNALCVYSGVTITFTGNLTTNGVNPSIFGSCNSALSLQVIGTLNTGATTVSIGGFVSVTLVSSYIVSTAGGSWTVAGAWYNATTSASWSFAAPIVFTSSAPATMTFSGVATEFGGNVSFTPSSGTPTFLMSSHGFVSGGTVLVSASATLDTSTFNYPLGAQALTANGTLLSHNSTVTITNAATVGGTLTMATGTLTAASLSVSGTLTQAASTITLTGSVTVSGTMTSTTGPLSAVNLTVSGGTFNDGTATVTLTGNITSTAAGILGANGTFAFADNAGALLALSPQHTIDVAGSDLGTLNITGSTTLQFNSSLQTETVVIGTPVLFAFNNLNVAVTWTYNSTAALVPNNGPLYLESVTSSVLCSGIWTFSNVQTMTANNVYVCGSHAVFQVQDYTVPGNLGGNSNWLFGSGGNIAAPTIFCTSAYVALSDSLSCTTDLSYSPLANGFVWYVYGPLKVTTYTGPSFQAILLDPYLGPQTYTVIVTYGNFGALATKSVTVNPTQGNLLIYVASGFTFYLFYALVGDPGGRRAAAQKKRDAAIRAEYERQYRAWKAQVGPTLANQVMEMETELGIVPAPPPPPGERKP